MSEFPGEIELSDNEAMKANALLGFNSDLNESSPMTDDRIKRVRHEIELRQDNIKSHVDEVRTLSDREIMACGNVLSRIVEDVKGIIYTADAKVRSSGAQSEKITQDFIEKFRREADAQTEAVARISECALNIEAAVEYVDKLRYTSEILATNALIEAAHLGKEGRAFSEIAQQLRDQSKLVKSTTINVKLAVDTVRDGVIGVAAGSESIQESTNVYIKNMQNYLQESAEESAAGGGENALALVVKLSNQALSHLQFHDPMVQRLGHIEKEVAKLLERIEPILTGANNIGEDEILDNESYSNDSPTAGDIMLF